MKKIIKKYFKFFVAAVFFIIVISFAYLRISSKSESFNLKTPGRYGDALELRSGFLALSIAPLGGREARAEADGAGAIFKDAYEKTDVRNRVESYLFKEDIILKEPGHPAQFLFRIGADGLSAKKEPNGDLGFYSSEHKPHGQDDPHSLDLIFSIPAAFLIDAKGGRSSTKDVAMEYSNGVLTLIPDKAWLSSHPYPIILDPSVEISVLNLYSHPLTGDDWIVSFVTRGQADLSIAPNDAATVADDEFVSLWCGERQMNPQTLAGDIIFFKNWECAEPAKIIHNTKKAGDHTLKFQFGAEIAYAYNHFSGDRRYAWSENSGWINASSTHEKLTISNQGVTGYAWGENIGWIKFDYDGTAGATNTTATDWGVINDGLGNLGGYAWGENIGWINFHPTHSQVKVDRSTGDFSGYAWGGNVGWINFGHTLSNYVMRYQDPPEVFTKPAASIGSKTVTARGESWRRGADITERGFKYGLTETDTWTKSESGSFDSGNFELFLENLTPDSTYYVRAYAVNSEGTVYGSYVSFATEASQKGSPIIFNENTLLKEDLKMR